MCACSALAGRRRVRPRRRAAGSTNSAARFSRVDRRAPRGPRQARGHQGLHAGDDDAIQGARSGAARREDSPAISSRPRSSSEKSTRTCRALITTGHAPRRDAAAGPASRRRHAQGRRRSRTRRGRSGGAAAPAGVAARPSRGADVHLHALPAARVLPADGPAFSRCRRRSRNAGARRRPARLGHTSIPSSTRRPCSRRMREASRPIRASGTSSPATPDERRRVRQAIRRHRRARRDEPADIIAQPADRRHRRRRPPRRRSHPATSGRRLNSLPTSKRLPLPRTDRSCSAGAAAHAAERRLDRATADAATPCSSG